MRRKQAREPIEVTLEGTTGAPPAAEGAPERYPFLVDGSARALTIDQATERTHEFLRWWLEAAVRLNDTHRRTCVLELGRVETEQGPAFAFRADFTQDARNHLELGELNPGVVPDRTALQRLKEDTFLHTQVQGWLKDMRQPGLHYEGDTRGRLTLDAPVRGAVTVRREDGRKKA